MGIKKYNASQDNTITNAYGIDLSTRATGSNMGASDILEIFSIYGLQSTSSAELSRVLIKFPIDIIVTPMAITIPIIPKKFPCLDVSGEDNPLKAKINNMPETK